MLGGAAGGGRAGRGAGSADLAAESVGRARVGRGLGVATTTGAAAGTAGPVSLVTQTRVRPEAADAFGRWQEGVNAVVARFPGYVDHEVMPPRPPVQVDWVIVQRFAEAAAARAWLGSEERRRLLAEAEPWLVGQDDVHLIADGGPGSGGAPVAAMISTVVRPGQEAAFRTWQGKIAASQARFAGFQGYKLEPPVAGVQEDWVVLLRFDSEPHLAAWLASPERERLVAESAAFTTGTRVRTVATGFDQWFRAEEGGAETAPPAWKQNMLVVLALYPVVFLFGVWVQGPLLEGRVGLPFWLALFVGNVASVLILSKLVPAVSKRFGWWLAASGDDQKRVGVAGAALVVGLYGLLLLLFSRIP